MKIGKFAENYKAQIVGVSDFMAREALIAFIINGGELKEGDTLYYDEQAYTLERPPKYVINAFGEIFEITLYFKSYEN